MDFSPLGDRSVFALRADVERKRDCGEVILDIRKVGSAADTQGVHVGPVLDAFAHELGLSGLSSSWTIVRRSAARGLLVRILTRDLALNAPVMSREDGERLADRFLQFFPSPTRFFSNTPVSDESELEGEDTWTGSFQAISEATFDTGIVALGDGRIGMLWVKDEG